MKQRSQLFTAGLMALACILFALSLIQNYNRRRYQRVHRIYPARETVSFMKPGALQDAERVAHQLQSEQGSIANLRQLFERAKSVPHTNNWTKLTLPKELTSSLWTGAITTASWAEDGTLKSITVFRGPYEPAIIIGPPDATPITLNLISNDGHPSFYASAGSGIYTLILTYK
jgi:hypothetical protein